MGTLPSSEWSEKRHPLAQTTAERNLAGDPGAPDAHAGTSMAEDELEHPGIERADLIRIGIVALAAGLVWFRVGEPFPRISIIGLLALLAGGYPIFKEALENIWERRMTMELSMTIALVAAAAIGEFFTALMIALFVLVAEVLEGLTVRRGRRAIRNLLDFLPNTACMRRSGVLQDVSLAEIQPGELVIVRPGGRIPVDGSILSGHSFVDEATITGESMPVEKVPGANVYAGTINQSGVLEVRVERLGRDTAFGKIIEAIERAKQSRAPIQRTADRLAGYLVYFALGAAVLTFVITHNMRSTISVIIVAGACGVAAGTPLAILGAIGQAARQGAIIKGGLYLELLAKVDTVLLDKTGTVTFGTPEVRGLHPAEGVTPQTLLETAACAELPSEHPMAKAILRKAAQFSIRMVEPDRFHYSPGKGVTALCGPTAIAAGNRALLKELDIAAPAADPDDTNHASEVLVARDGRFLGAIEISDSIRPEARDAVRAMKSMGMKMGLITGDARGAALRVGGALGLNAAEMEGELLPENKVQYVARCVENGATVAMVGDGINDAPALMQASVGVAMGSGTDVARESAQVVLIGNDLSKFAETLRIARCCHRTIMQNFAGTLLVDAIGIGLAAVGMLNPLLAAFIHVTSELTFILNSARLLPGGAHRSVEQTLGATANQTAAN